MTDRDELIQHGRAMAFGIEAGNVADPHGRKVGLIRELCDEIARLRAEIAALKAVPAGEEIAELIAKLRTPIEGSTVIRIQRLHDQAAATLESLTRRKSVPAGEEV